MEQTLALRTFEEWDLPTVRRWLALPHVAKWYTEPQDWLYELEHRKDEFRWLHHFIAEADGVPFGFCQYYEYRMGGESWQGDLPVGGSYSIDYLIGEPSLLGRGLGKWMILQLVRRVRAQTGAARILVQPEPENAASCRALASAGFHFDAANGVYVLTLS